MGVYVVKQQECRILEDMKACWNSLIKYLFSKPLTESELARRLLGLRLPS